MRICKRAIATDQQPSAIARLSVQSDLAIVVGDGITSIVRDGDTDGFQRAVNALVVVTDLKHRDCGHGTKRKAEDTSLVEGRVLEPDIRNKSVKEFIHRR